MQATTSIAMQRLPGWPELLAAFVAQRSAMPFAWGTNDCCTFASDGVLAITGTDPMADLRGYTSAAHAQRILVRGGGLMALVSERLGWHLETKFAQRGDMVLVPMADDQQFLGLCMGSTFAAPGPHRMVIGPMSTALACWPIGRG
jgi:hypothetical protein